MHCVWAHNVYYTCICECINHIYEADGRESSWGELGGKVGFQQAPVGRSSKPAVQNNCCPRQHLLLLLVHISLDITRGLSRGLVVLRKWDVDGRCPLGHSQGGSTYLYETLKLIHLRMIQASSRMREQYRESTYRHSLEREEQIGGALSIESYTAALLVI